MIAVDTLPVMAELMDRQRLVGWLVRDAITNEGISYTEASRRWPMSLPTLNRLMTSGNVNIRFYRTAERNLESLPAGLLEHVVDGNAEAIQAMPDLDEKLRGYILAELGEPPAPPARTRGRRNA